MEKKNPIHFKNKCIQLGVYIFGWQNDDLIEEKRETEKERARNREKVMGDLVREEKNIRTKKDAM